MSKDIRVFNPKSGVFDYYELSKLADKLVGKDRSGKDVYENDIVCVKRKDGDGNRTVDFTGVVKLSAGKGVYLLKDSKVHSLYLRYCTKIGNIHEHSDSVEAFRKIEPETLDDILWPS